MSECPPAAVKMDQVRTQICAILKLKPVNLREFPVEHDRFGGLGGTTIDGYNRIAFPKSERHR